MRALPNLITFTRLLSSPVLAWLLAAAHYRAALILVIYAGLTDWMDGYAARRFGSDGRLGVLFDPLADKALLVTLFVTLGWLSLIPAWLFWLVLGRDLVIVVGAVLVRLLRNVRTFRPTVLGKVSTFFQIVYVLLVLAFLASRWEWIRWLVYAGLLCTAVFTAASGIDYVRIGIRMARRQFPAQA